MPAIRTRVRDRGHRLSSPLLPERILPTTEERDFDEVERVRQNAEVCALKGVSDEHKEDYDAACRFIYARADYEESHGKFVPDKDLPDWLARKNSTYKKLIKMRADCRGLSVVESAAKFEAYFNAVKAFTRDFAAPFAPDDAHTAYFNKQAELLAEWDILMAAANGGEQNLVSRITSRPFHFIIKNPYKLTDQQRVEFDDYLRCMYVRLSGEKHFRPTLTEKNFDFYITNPYKTGTTRSYEFHLALQRGFKQARAKAQEAREHARGPRPSMIPPCVFYGH